VGFAVAAAGLVLGLKYRPYNSGEIIGADFHTYLAAAVVGVQHGWTHIYDQSLVAVAQKELDPGLWSQPYLSPPGVAWLVAPLTAFPYKVAYWTWALLTFWVYAIALAWSGTSRGLSRWVAVVAALAPWWVMHSVTVGQVVLVAAGVVVAWRLVREKKDIAAGIALSVICLKPNIAILVPFALLVAGRYRVFAAWSAMGAVFVLVAFVTIGADGMTNYVAQLLGPLPPGADRLALKGATGVTGVAASLVRVLIIGTVLLTAFKLRGSPGLAIPVAIVGTLLVSPYLHESDLCMFSTAAWIVWEERNALAWRVSLALGWVVASPYLVLIGLSPSIYRWPWLEFALLLALVVVAWRPLTGAGDLRTRAPA
jgi:hypothetical protein